MVPEHSPIRDFEAERDLTSNLVELSGSVVTVFLGNESYRGILGIEVNEDFSDFAAAAKNRVLKGSPE